MIHPLALALGVVISAFAWAATVVGWMNVSQAHGGAGAAVLFAAGVVTLVAVFVLTRRASRNAEAPSPAAPVFIPLLTLFLGLLAVPFMFMLLLPRLGE